MITEDLELRSERAQLPPRIGKLISAAVRVWELKRAIRGGASVTHHLRGGRHGHAAARTL